MPGDSIERRRAKRTLEPGRRGIDAEDASEDDLRDGDAASADLVKLMGKIDGAT